MKKFLTENIINRINNFIFRWSKWSLYEEDLHYTILKYNPILDMKFKSTKVIVDIYVKTNKYNGIKKYKKVIKK